MAGVNIFDKFGIKEVANVYFEALEDDVKAGVYAGDIVLFLDTLKVSTIETSAEDVAAQGGWGNPRLIVWDFNKEINITLEDALISLESLRFMLGGAIKRPATGSEVIVRHTEEVIAGENGIIPLPKDHLDGVTMTPQAYAGYPIRFINLTKGYRSQIVYSSENNAANAMTADANGASTTKVLFYNKAFNVGIPATQGGDKGEPAAAGDHIRIFWVEKIASAANTNGESAVEVTISPSTFPGTYRVVGDTFMRNQNGKDRAFQFVIDRAKVLSNVTITLEAEGDPSTFEMQLQVLRGESGDEMMKLVRYDFEGDSDTSNGDDYGSLTTGT